MTQQVPQQQRGRRRRDALLEAASKLLAEGGLRAVSHRAVAERAGVPLAATTYYFNSRAELVEQSFEQLVRREVRWARSRMPYFPDAAPEPHRLAETVVATLFPRNDTERSRLASLFELCAQAGREEQLRPLLAMWTDGLVEIATETLRRAGYRAGEQDARLLVGLVDGLLLETFEHTPEASAARATETLTHALTLLR